MHDAAHDYSARRRQMPSPPPALTCLRCQLHVFPASSCRLRAAALGPRVRAIGAGATGQLDRVPRVEGLVPVRQVRHCRRRRPVAEPTGRAFVSRTRPAARHVPLMGGPRINLLQASSSAQGAPSLLAAPDVGILPIVGQEDRSPFPSRRHPERLSPVSQTDALLLEYSPAAR